jgi:hypothetical protein
MKIALVLMTVAVLLLGGQVIAQELRAAKPKLAPGTGVSWVGATKVEVIGAAFPTLPAPYVSIDLKTALGQDGTTPDNQARASLVQRATLSVAEAEALRSALDEWLADPSTTQTLLVKGY